MDPVKAETNLKKHQVSFEEASTVFDDPLFITFLDVERSVDEAVNKALRLILQATQIPVKASVS